MLVFKTDEKCQNCEISSHGTSYKNEPKPESQQCKSEEKKKGGGGREAGEGGEEREARAFYSRKMQMLSIVHMSKTVN